MAHDFEIPVSNPVTLTEAGFDKIRVYRATGPTGTYTLQSATLDLDRNTYIYLYQDATGTPGNWYKYAFYNSGSAIEDTQSSPTRGGQLNYCRIGDIKAGLGEVLPTDDPLLIQKVQSATSLIQQYLNYRDFNQVYETRYFSCSPRSASNRVSGRVGGYSWSGLQGEQLLDLFYDDLVNVTSLVCDFSNGRNELLETWVEGADFFVSRISHPATPYWPFDRLEVLSDMTTKSGYFPKGYRAIRITGVWGWPANPFSHSSVPAEIQEACIQVATRMYKGKDNAYSRVVGNREMGTMQIMDNLLNKDVLASLQPYKRLRIMGGDDVSWSTERV
jgi:hypothetical protein